MDETPGDTTDPRLPQAAVHPHHHHTMAGRLRYYAHAYGGPLIAIIAVAAASYLLYLQFTQPGQSPAEIWEKAKEIPLRRYVLALALIGVHYIIFGVYEQVGLIYLKSPLSLP